MDTPIDKGTMEELPENCNEKKDFKKKKFLALFQARTVLSKIGTMAERATSKKQLKRMKKLGIKSV